MAISLLTNLPAEHAQNGLSSVAEAYGKSVGRIASGLKNQQLGDNPSDAIRASLLEVELRGNHQASSNVQEALSLIQVSEGGLNSINDLLLRLRDITIQAASDYVNDQERQILTDEAVQIRKEIDRISNTTSYRGKSLLNGMGGQLTFQVGAQNHPENRITYDAGAIDVRPDTLELEETDLSDPDAALESLESIDRAIGNLQQSRAHAGAFQARLNSASNQLALSEETITSDISRLRDTDLATEATNAVRLKLQQQAAIAILSQANTSNDIALKLLDPIGQRY